MRSTTVSSRTHLSLATSLLAAIVASYAVSPAPCQAAHAPFGPPRSHLFRRHASPLATTLPMAGVNKEPASSAPNCAEPSFTSCGHLDVLPANFCCPPSTHCIPLNQFSSIICCPDGQDCQFIQPIPCDISQQNVATHPRNPVLNANLTATLAACGAGSCCPQGYTCLDGGCTMNKADAVISASASASATSTSATSSPTATGSATKSAAAAHSTPSSASHSTFSGSAFAAGFLPGIIIGAILAVIGCMLYQRRRRRRLISNPIPQAHGASPPSTLRSDFLRRSHSRDRRPPGRRSRLLSNFGLSVFGNTNNHAASNSHSHSHNGGGGGGLRRSDTTASMEFILAEPIPPAMADVHPAHRRPLEIFHQSPGKPTAAGITLGPAPPSASSPPSSYARAFGRHQRQQSRAVSQITAFTDLMETAGLRKGEPYVPAAAAAAGPDSSSSPLSSAGGGMAAVGGTAKGKGRAGPAPPASSDGVGARSGWLR